MKLFRLRRKAESGEQEKELVLDTEAEPETRLQDGAEADVNAQAVPDTRASEAAPFLYMASEGESELESEQRTPEAKSASPQEASSLDPRLLDALREDENSIPAGTPASQPEDIPIRDLLSDLVGVSRRLGIEPHTSTEPTADQPCDAHTALVREERPTLPCEEKEPVEPYASQHSQTMQPALTGYRRYTLHGLFLGLALAAAIGGTVGAQRLDGTEATASPSPQSQTGHPKIPVVATAMPSATAMPGGQIEATPEPSPTATPEPSPTATPEPTPEPPSQLEPAYFMYTVQPGDSIHLIAQTFGISPDYILWNNPGVIEDPNLLLVGEQLLIPGVDGLIYRVRPGETLADIATRYQIDVESIVSFAPNGLISPDDNIAGMILILPGATPPPQPGPAEAAEPLSPQPQPTEPPQATETPKPTETPQPTEQPEPTETPQATETPATEPSPTEVLPAEPLTVPSPSPTTNDVPP
ncbi:MAG: LysM peptidoglycan-binding domain-containing protein [Dehalococcoidia bacterium]